MKRRWATWTSVAALVLVVAIAALAFVAALANAFNWKGWWVIAIAVTLALLTLVWKVWSDVIVPARRRKASDVEEHGHATALKVDLSPDNDGDVEVWLTNRGTHEARRIEVVGMPAGGDRENLAGPPFIVSKGVTHFDVGGDLFCRVKRIDPKRAVRLAIYPAMEGPTEIRFEVWWTDHEGRRRYSVGIGDLADPRRSIEMVPRSA